MTPEQLTEFLRCLDVAAETQDRMATSLEHDTSLPGFQYSSGRANGLRMAKGALLGLLGAEAPGE